MARVAVGQHAELYVNGSFTVDRDVRVPRFEVGPEALEHLRREGYVVIKNANESEVAHARELLWSFLEGTGVGISRHKPSSWLRSNPNQYGIVWGFGAGHSRLAWFLRTRPRLMEMFELAWGTRDLLASFEGFSWFPPHASESRWRLAEGWFHTDQNDRSRPGAQTLQSLTSLYDQDESTGGFVVVPRSWEGHPQLTDRVYAAAASRGYRVADHQQFLMVPSNDPLLSAPHRPHLVRARAGDAVLWDSRTVHCSTPPMLTPQKELVVPLQMAEAPAPTAAGEAEARPEEEERSTRPARVAVYCSMAPRERASDEVIMDRQRAMLLAQTCTHWPFEVTCLPAPAEAGEVASDTLPRATELHKRLVGYTSSQLESIAAAAPPQAGGSDASPDAEAEAGRARRAPAAARTVEAAAAEVFASAEPFDLGASIPSWPSDLLRPPDSGGAGAGAAERQRQRQASARTRGKARTRARGESEGLRHDEL